MSLIRKIATFILRSKARKVKRTVATSNFQNAKSVGIIFPITDPTEFRAVKVFVQELKERGVKEIKAIGYNSSKVIPEFCTRNIHFDFFTKKEGNFLRFPTSVSCLNFVAEEHDILIDLSRKTHFPLLYLLAMSQAKMKVGYNIPEKSEWLDFMITMEEKESCAFFIKEINRYMDMLKVA